MSGPAPLAIGFEEAPWRFEDAWMLRAIDGDTQVYRTRQTVQSPRRKATLEDDWIVRLLETDSAERRTDYDAWLAEKLFAERFHLDEQPDGSVIARNTLLVLTGRTDVYGRWLGWAVGGLAGENLSYALNREFGREAEPLKTQTARLMGVA